MAAGGNSASELRSQVSAFKFPIIKFCNRVLSDYPAARVRLQTHCGKIIAAQIGPIETCMRITRDGEMELVGNTGNLAPAQRPDVSLTLPLSLLPGLAAKDLRALSQLAITGDSELAATLSDIARNVEWDVEADLSRVFGDVTAHHLVASARRVRAFRVQAGQRFTDNVAEYLTEERLAFITARDLDALTQQNETLRDDIARLDARLAQINLSA